MSETLSAEQSRWVEQFVPTVVELARHIARRLPNVTEDDLVSAGYEGLVHAALRYVPSSGVPFAAWAHYRVRGAMIDAGRRAAPEVRRRTRALRALEATQALLEHAQRKLVHRDAVDPRSLRQRIEAAAELVAQTTTAVILSRIGPEDPDVLVEPTPDMEARMLEEQELAGVRRALDACADDERALFEALYVRGLSMHEYALECGKSTSTVSRHHAKLISRLSALLRHAGPTPARSSAPPPADTPTRTGARPSGLGPRGPPAPRDS
jgi:RNA polymerase sigma factor for flagellar operon FliA